MNRKRVLMALDWYDSDLHRGIAAYARERDWVLNTHMARTHHIPEGWEGDGVIGLMERPTTRAFVRSLKLPTVDIGGHFTEFPQVLSDNYRAGAMGAEHLLERNHTNFAFFFIQNSRLEKEVSAGYIQTVESTGRTCLLRHWNPMEAEHEVNYRSVHQWAQATRAIPELRFVNHYHDHADYIAALASSVQRHWKKNGKPDKLVMSFHGVPERTLHLGDPYHCECFKTARLLGEQLGLSKDQYQVTFQSRLGRAKWLEPYTEPTLIAMGKAGVQRVDVICPGFTSDCLETLEEINMEAREAFLHAGGKEFHYIPCLNDDPEWITALCNVTQQHLQGWNTVEQADAQALAASRAAALAQGAAQ